MKRFRLWIGLVGTCWIACAMSAHAQTCIAPPAGLAHWWRGEGNAFDTVSVQDGFLIGGVQFTDGKVGTGFLLSGDGGDYIALPPNLFPMPAFGQGKEPFSFELWFQTTTPGVILGQQDLVPFESTLAGYVPAIYVGTNGLLYVLMFWATAPSIISLRVVNDGQFHHLVVTYDGAVENAYLDGALIGSTPLIQEGYSPVYNYQLGTGITGGWEATTGEWFPFGGVLDEISLYNRALTAGEVAALFNAGSAGKCAPPNAGLVLRHRYSFDGPPAGMVVTDSIRRAHGSVVYGSTVAPYTNGTPDGSGLSDNGTLELQGSSGCVVLPPRLISVLPKFTIEAWVTWHGPLTSVWQRVFDFGFSDRGTNANGLGTNYVIFTPARGGSGRLGFEQTTVNPFGAFVDPESLILTGAGPLPLGEEVYIAITYDPPGGSTRLYLNGALVASSSSVVNPSSEFSDYNNWLGRSQWDRDPYFSGSYNEFRIWEGILPEQEIASHYALGPNQSFVTTRPKLSITPSIGGLILSWPSNGTDAFQLQRTPGLHPPAWVALTNGVTHLNGNARVVLPATTGSAFYRLRQ